MYLIAKEDGKPLLLNPAAILRVEPADEGMSRITLLDGHQYLIQIEFRAFVQDIRGVIQFCPVGGIRR